MIVVLKALLFGQTKKLAVLGSGLQISQTTGTTRIVCILLERSMDTLGMTCPAITVSTSLVLQVKNLLLMCNCYIIHLMYGSEGNS